MILSERIKVTSRPSGQLLAKSYNTLASSLVIFKIKSDLFMFNFVFTSERANFIPAISGTV